MQTFNGVKWQTFGHQNIKNILEKQILAGKIPHAYLFSGSGGLGKKVLALEFARKVLGTEKLENHPDFQILDLGANEIPAEALKDFIAKTAFKPFLAQKKVAIINNAENLNAQSSNALLKTLEEPSGSSVIILIVGTQQILPTIYSRCQVLRFNVFTADDLEDFAKQQSWGVSKEIISLSFGQIGRLKNLFEHKEFLQEQKELIARYENLAEISMGERLVAIGSYAEKENPELAENFLTWLNWQLANINLQTQHYTRLTALSQAMSGLKANFNKKIVLQSLFLKI